MSCPSSWRAELAVRHRVTACEVLLSRRPGLNWERDGRSSSPFCFSRTGMREVEARARRLDACRRGVAACT